MPNISLWLSSLALAITASAQAQTLPVKDPAPTDVPSVQVLIGKMSQNAAHINYRGSFIYQNQTSIELQSFRVEHWIENGVEHDRFLFLNGPERLIVRDGQRVDCKAMGDELLQGGFAKFGANLVKMDQLYQFEIRGRERIAGRWSRVLQVIPKDPFRYGYLLSIDEETGLVLKSWLIDENARPLERYQFISIDLNADVSQMKARSSNHEHKAIADVTPCNPTALSKPTAWQLGWIPPGFAFAGERQLANGQTMLMYTDGLTTFSVFIEVATTPVPEGQGKRGATLAYMSRLVVKNTTYRANVVGEIPIAAAAKIAQNITGL